MAAPADCHADSVHLILGSGGVPPKHRGKRQPAVRSRTLGDADQLPQDVAYMLHKLRRQVRMRWESKGRSMASWFDFVDTNGDGAVDFHEFKISMAALGMQLNERDARVLYCHFDDDSSGTIDASELMRGILLPLSARRKRVVRETFQVPLQCAALVCDFSVLLQCATSVCCFSVRLQCATLVCLPAATFVFSRLHTAMYCAAMFSSRHCTRVL
jgi:hypothetical protein